MILRNYKHIDKFEKLCGDEILQFMQNDGFENEKGFWLWFTERKIYRIIHWTDLKYLTEISYYRIYEQALKQGIESALNYLEEKENEKI